ncbi:hypothetical protein F4803DRAFT_350628 [Xylaria telfairii]|nr:hypothetical protein F4803DRAFT_350628 [Xylaria telfairii]
MGSSRLNDFHLAWTRRGTLMADDHLEELMCYKHEADKRKQRAREAAETQLESLRNNKDTLPTNFDDEARKIKRSLNATLESIDEESNEMIRSLKETQSKEKAAHERAYHEALVARPFMNDISSDYSATTTTVPTIDNISAPDNGNTLSASRTLTSISPGPPQDPIQDAIPTTTVPKTQDQPALLRKRFSCTVQPLQETMESRANQSLPLSVNPLPIASTSDHELGGLRTITFDEVYQNGQAEHKDTIVEFPPGSRQWYIVKCEEHGIRFGRRPLRGAAKHLNGRLHGCLERSSTVAMQVLGYRVIDCNEGLAALNNDVVNSAFAHGYKPENNSNKKRSETTIKATQGASKISQEEGGTLQAIAGKPASLSSGQQCKGYRKHATKIITNPKPFHIYYCLWKADHRRVHYPVMILAWDDQKPGGLEHDLVSTGLLDRNSDPPNCYIYKDADSGKNKAIAGWAPGFEDGGSRVTQRKFPAMFFDPDQAVSWVSAKLLSKFPLFKPDPPKKKSHPFNMARLWIAKNNGFTSWEKFEEAKKRGEGEQPPPFVRTPSVSSLSDINDSGSDSDAGSSVHSAASNVTEKELLEWQEKAGEITGDSDYAGSDVDSTLEDEYEEWGQVEADGRPWAWYGLRNKTHTDAEKTELIAHTAQNSSADNEAVLSIQKSLQMARHLSKRGSTQDDRYPLSEDPNAETKLSEDPAEGTGKNLAQSGEHRSSRSTPVTNLYAANATPPPTRPISRHITEADDNDGVERGFQTILRTPATLPKTRPSPCSAEPGEISKGTKRARSEEQVKTNEASRQEKAKKLKQDTETSRNQARMSIDSESRDTTPATVVPLFKPKNPLGPVIFELSSYKKGAISWSRESAASSLKLYYGEGDRTVGTVDGVVNILIDPATLRGIKREKMPESGNVATTLFSKDTGDTPVRVVFDRPVGSKADIGKVQSRRFIQWIRGIVPALPLLED